jgi:uncharacterized membrane protein
MPTHADMLAEVPFFSLLDDQERATLAEQLDILTAPAGRMLFQLGDPGGALYVVRKGAVELFCTNDEGEHLILERRGPGDFFGELGLLDGGSRSATAVVTQDLEALVVDRNDLEILFRLRPAAAMDILTASGRRLRETVNLLRNSVSRNVNDEAADNRTRVQKASDWISEFSGSIPFLLLHCVVFFLWIIDNVGPLRNTRIGGWDPYPFGLLTMSVSLEAIVLSVFVLLSQNRQAARDRVRNDIEYQVNLRAEREISHLHDKVDRLQEVIGRLGHRLAP